MTKETKIKTIQFEQLMKDFKKYVAKKSDPISRPVLQYVYFDGKNFVATNSHVLLRVNSEHVSDIPMELEKGMLYNPNDMKIVEMEVEYPNVSRLIPDHHNLTIRFNNILNEFQSYVRDGNKLLTGSWEDKIFKFICQDDYLEINPMKDGKRLDQSIMKHNDFLHSNGDEIVISVRSRYITNALITTKKLWKLNNEDVTLNMVTGMRPILIQQKGLFDLLILPVRTY